MGFLVFARQLRALALQHEWPVLAIDFEITPDGVMMLAFRRRA